MKNFRLVALSILVFIVALTFALVILFSCGGLAFLFYAILVSCVIGVTANYIFEKRSRI
jgi:hypothetical protein